MISYSYHGITTYIEHTYYSGDRYLNHCCTCNIFIFDDGTTINYCFNAADTLFLSSKIVRGTKTASWLHTVHKFLNFNCNYDILFLDATDSQIPLQGSDTKYVY